MVALSLTNVSVSFRSTTSLRGHKAGHFSALQGIDLELKAGDRIGLIGKNGAGKSTLLRTMAGIYPPNSGVVRSEGRVSTLLNIGLGMQLDYSGYQNIEIWNLLNNVPKSKAAQLTKEIADFTELGDFLREPIRNYSSGMAMRLRFACATAIQPDILLLDEWLGAGDNDFQEKAKLRMEELSSNAGIVVLATHNIPLMSKVCDRAIWLEDGHIRMFDDIDYVIKERQKVMVYGEAKS